MGCDADPRPRFWRRPAWWASQLAFLGLFVYVFGDAILCMSSCHIDVERMQGHALNVADILLNSWALAWVLHAWADPAASIWDAPIFHPHPGMLTGSEHLIGIAVPLLPLKLLDPSAMLLHQTATLLSFLVLGWTSYAFVSWVTRSDWAAFVAACATAYMPWRFFEFGHIQILCLSWYPLIWLLVARSLTERVSAGRLFFLFLVLFLQLTTSYYLAYQIIISLSILLPILAWIHGPGWQRLGGVIAVMGLACVALAWISLPYFLFESSGRLVDRPGGAGNVGIETKGLVDFALMVFGTIVSNFATSGPYEPIRIPASLQLAAVAALVFGWAQKPWHSGSAGRPFVYAIFLAICTAVAFVLAMGNYELAIASLKFKSPGLLMTEVVPGYSHIRGELRWRYLAGVAVPILAAIGVLSIEKWLSNRSNAWFRVRSGALRASMALVFWIEFPIEPVPVRAIEWPADPSLYREIEQLSAGPVLELPWSRNDFDRTLLEPSYMLAATLHWKPLLNGYTRFWPPGIPMLQEIAQDLPQPSAVDLLVRLTGLRWVVLHSERLNRNERKRWEQADADSTLQRVGGDEKTWIFELPAGDGRGPLKAAMLSETDPDRTVTGLSRAPIELGPGEATWSANLPRRIISMGTGNTKVQIENRSARDWPGVDVDAEGLLRLRYRYVDWKRQTVLEGLAPIRSDIAAGSTWQRELELPAPGQPRRYHLTLDLVQIVDGEATPIGLPEQSRWVIVKPFGGFGVREQPKPESGPGPDAAGLDSRADPAAAASGLAHGDENR